MKILQTALAALAVAWVAQQANAESIEVEVFSDGNHPLAGLADAQSRGARITLYDLGVPAQLAGELSAGLPDKLELARAVAMARIDAIGLDEIKRRFQESYSGQFKAFDYRIDRYPAIVFDKGAAVVYDVPDVMQALQRYRDWKASRNE